MIDFLSSLCLPLFCSPEWKVTLKSLFFLSKQIGFLFHAFSTRSKVVTKLPIKGLSFALPIVKRAAKDIAWIYSFDELGWVKYWMLLWRLLLEAVSHNQTHRIRYHLKAVCKACVHNYVVWLLKHSSSQALEMFVNLRLQVVIKQHTHYETHDKEDFLIKNSLSK